MALVWNVIYLIVIMGSAFVATIFASKKGYSEAVWFLVPLFGGFINYFYAPILMIVVFVLKDLNKFRSEISHKKIELEMEAGHQGSVSDASVYSEEVIQLDKKWIRTKRFGNWIGILLLIVVMFTMLFLAF